MAILVDDAAGAVLGPWGLALGAGIGVALLARKRLAPVAESVVVGSVATGERARGWAAELGVTERARTALAELSDWWSDLYAEARAEWEASRPAPAVAPAAATAATTRTRRRSQSQATTGAKATRPRASGRADRTGESRPRRQRGPDGRFLRRSE